VQGSIPADAPRGFLDLHRAAEKAGIGFFSLPALVAPYAGVTTAAYGWYPNRYGAKDALRMGNYSLLESMGANIALEFLYSVPHSLLSHH